MYQIAFYWDEACENELKKMGFKKQTVYIRDYPGTGTTEEDLPKAEKEIFQMRHKPFQFVATSYWGAGAD